MYLAASVVCPCLGPSCITAVAQEKYCQLEFTTTTSIKRAPVEWCTLYYCSFEQCARCALFIWTDLNCWKKSVLPAPQQKKKQILNRVFNMEDCLLINKWIGLLFYPIPIVCSSNRTVTERKKQQVTDRITACYYWKGTAEAQYQPTSSQGKNPAVPKTTQTERRAEDRRQLKRQAEWFNEHFLNYYSMTLNFNIFIYYLYCQLRTWRVWRKG